MGDVIWKTVRISLGQYTAALQGPGDAIDHLSCLWSGYVVDTQEAPAVSVSLHCTDALPRREGVNGWQAEALDDGMRASYYVNGMLCFVLDYTRDRKNVTVTWDGKQWTNMVIGVQHAVMLGLSSCCVGLHGVTVICGSRAVILSAASGTGKTTLSKLLQRYNQTAVVNGDFALLALDASGVIAFEPTPFCGSSGIRHNYRLPVHQIVFLEQSPDNHWKELAPRQALLRMLSNVFIPEWDPEAKMAIQAQVSRIVNSVPINAYAFRPDLDAAEVFVSSLEG